jgi:type I restriction enzyme S subunit
VTGRYGTIGEVFYVTEPFWPLNTALYAIDFHGNDPRFVSYFLRNQLKDYQSNKAAVPGVDRNVLHKFPVRCTDSQTQKRIVSVLSAYDDLIENNRRRIGLLEEAARLLFREWFIHFRFPGHEQVKIIDGVPEGWKQHTFGCLFDFSGGFAFKSATYTDDGRFSVVTIKNVHDAEFVPECPSRVDEIPQKMKTRCRLSTGDILLSLTGNVGRACVVFGENYLLNQRVAKVVGKEGISDQFAYWTFSNSDTQKQLENLAYGVAQLNLSPVKLSERPFVRPSQHLMDDFTDITEPIFEQLIKINLYTQELTKARDLLLSCLMDGRLEI